MGETTYSLLSFVFVFILSLVVTKFIIIVTQKKNILQHTNHRSLHKIPTPPGGGWAIILSSILVWSFLFGIFNEENTILLVCVALLAIISWLDDMKTLPAFHRFGIQALAVAACLYVIPDENRILHADLPLVFDRVLSGICWLWFINLFNFMDGMDGLAGSETVCITIGIVLIGSQIGLAETHLYLALLLTAATIGFLFWNWAPARIFLGDVGSIPIGFLLGWLLIQLALNGALLAAVILPLYFLFDATFTLLKRVLKREKIWQAHRQHFYQQAALLGLSHRQVVLRIIPFNIILIGGAYASLSYPIVGIGMSLFAIVSIIFALFFFSQGSQSLKT
ncbi:MAG: glycosyltransferase family 4 protein [Pseudomonadota bacterium]